MQSEEVRLAVSHRGRALGRVVARRQTGWPTVQPFSTLNLQHVGSHRLWPQRDNPCQARHAAVSAAAGLLLVHSLLGLYCIQTQVCR